MGWKAFVAGGVLCGVVAGFVSGRLHRTAAALIGAAVVLLTGVVSQQQAFSHIDLNVLALLCGMMVIVAALRPTGFFEWLAIRTAKLAGGDPLKIMVLFALVTAFVSAFLDNVTTILLTAPVSMAICAQLRIDPVPALIAQAVASNFGGTATLIGDPPNILIGSAVNLSFNSFIINLGPLVVAVLAAYAVFLLLAQRKKVGYVSASLRARLLEMDEKRAIRDPKLLKKMGALLACVLAAFFLHEILDVKMGAIAIAGAAASMLISAKSVRELLSEIEWDTIFFFIGLFIVVGAAEETGLLAWLGKNVLTLAGTHPAVVGLVVMWSTAAISAFIDNIPVTAVMIPLIKAFQKQHGGGEGLWWALALGVCFGGNATIVGAAANVVVTGIAERSGYHLSFARFAKHGTPVTAAALAIASVYVLLRYFL